MFLFVVFLVLLLRDRRVIILENGAVLIKTWLQFRFFVFLVALLGVGVGVAVDILSMSSC